MTAEEDRMRENFEGFKKDIYLILDRYREGGGDKEVAMFAILKAVDIWCNEGKLNERH
jgi:hypothetical protein